MAGYQEWLVRDPIEEPRTDRRRDADDSPAREGTTRSGSCGRQGNRVTFVPDAGELDEGVLVVQDRGAERPEKMALPVLMACS
jgi:hypothetical protein